MAKFSLDTVITKDLVGIWIGKHNRERLFGLNVKDDSKYELFDMRINNSVRVFEGNISLGRINNDHAREINLENGVVVSLFMIIDDDILVLTIDGERYVFTR